MTFVENETASSEDDMPQQQLASLEELGRQIKEAGHRRYELVRGIFGVVGDKWGIPILLVLATGRIRYSALRRTLDVLLGDTLPGHEHISQRILTLKLRKFEQLGLIVRRVSGDVPPKVDYALTDMGQELNHHVLTMIGWIGQKDWQRP